MCLMVASTEIISFDIKTQNQEIINDYFEARKTETNFAASTQVVINNTLNRLSKYVGKNFHEITRDDLISFLNTLRKNETEDPIHKWIGTYNLYFQLILSHIRM